MPVIDFTCKRISIKDIIKCNYDLNDTEYEIFKKIMLSKKGIGVMELAEKLGKHRTTIQKVLVKLTRKGLVKKLQVNLDRGYMFVYKAIDKEKIIEEIEKNVNEYTNTLIKSLRKWKGNG